MSTATHKTPTSNKGRHADHSSDIPAKYHTPGQGAMQPPAPNTKPTGEEKKAMQDAAKAITESGGK